MQGHKTGKTLKNKVEGLIEIQDLESNMVWYSDRHTGQYKRTKNQKLDPLLNVNRFPTRAKVV